MPPPDQHDRASYSIHGTAPSSVLEPESDAETASMLAQARTDGRAVIPVGGGTMLDVGAPPARYDLALCTQRLTGLVDYNPADLTVVARSGTTLAELNNELAAQNQFLPLEAPFADRATLGGVLATNSFGALRTGYGSARDMVIGMAVALPNGEIARSGGRVVKNVAGYDLSKLFIGSFGTLGVIVEVAFKTYPRPHRMQTLVVRTERDMEALALAQQAQILGPGLLGLMVVNGPLGHAVGVESAAAILIVGGTNRATDEIVGELRSAVSPRPVSVMMDGEGDQLLLALRDFPGEATAKIGTLPSHSSAALELDAESPTLVHPSLGLAYVRAAEWTSSDVETARKRLAPVGGQMILWHVATTLKEACVWGPTGPEIELMRRVKDVFDPERVLSPGRFVGNL